VDQGKYDHYGRDNQNACRANKADPVPPHLDNSPRVIRREADPLISGIRQISHNTFASRPACALAQFRQEPFGDGTCRLALLVSHSPSVEPH